MRLLMMQNSVSTSKFKRKYPRRIFFGAIGLLLKGNYYISSATTIGEGGLSFKWDQSIVVGTEIVISFKIPGESMISRRGEVRNGRPDNSSAQSKSFIIGVQFLPLTIAEKRKIRSYVSARSENEPTI